MYLNLELLQVVNLIETSICRPLVKKELTLNILAGNAKEMTYSDMFNLAHGHRTSCIEDVGVGVCWGDKDQKEKEGSVD